MKLTAKEIQLLILGSLQDGASYPYAIRKKMLNQLPTKLIQISESKFYYHFESLLKQQAIAILQTEKTDKGPERTLYHLTKQGQAFFQAKFAQAFQEATTIADLYVPLYFFDQVDLVTAQPLLAKRIAVLQKELEGYDVAWQSFAEAHHLSATNDAALFLLATEGIRHKKEELAGLKRCLHFFRQHESS